MGEIPPSTGEEASRSTGDTDPGIVRSTSGNAAGSDKVHQQEKEGGSVQTPLQELLAEEEVLARLKRHLGGAKEAAS